MIATLKKAGIIVEAFISIDEDLADNLSSYIKKGYVIAAVGGDGTIAAAAAVVTDSDAILAPLPGGTLNHFTKDAGITQDLKEAISKLPSAKPRTVDIATVNGRIFINNSSLGIYPSSLQGRQYFEKRLSKWPAAVIASIRAFVRFRLYDVTIDGESFKTPFVFVGNNVYDLTSGGQRGILTEGKLCLYAVASRKRRSLVIILFHTLLGRPDNANDFYTKTTSKVVIHSKRETIRISVDGELIRQQTPLTYESQPRGLTIL